MRSILMRFIQTCIILMILFVSGVSYGQATGHEIDYQEKSDAKKTNRQQSAQKKSETIKNDDGYMGNKKLFLERLTVSEIPEDFPKYREELSAERYTVLVKYWARKNINLIKEEYRSELD